jgi:glycosyltransferase involved in cell wall biosynthesis
MPDVLVFSALVPKLRGAKLLLDLHDPMPELMMTIFGASESSLTVRLLKWLEKHSISFADRVLTVNLACKKIFSARSCPPEKILVIMNSPDEEVFAIQKNEVKTSVADLKPFVVMYHGTIVERNGLDVAVQALREVRKTGANVELWIYGKSSQFLDVVMKEVAASGLESAVRYLGKRSAEGIAQAIKECDLGVIPNRRSAFAEINTPTRIFEYLSLGKPVIAPRVPGITDYFKEEDLVFFELGNAHDLAQKIEYVYGNPLKVKEITARGQRVHRNNDWPRQRQELLGLIEHLCAKEEHA